MILILVKTGIRFSELVGMKLSDINNEKGYIKVLAKGTKQLVVRIVKNTESTLALSNVSHSQRGAGTSVNQCTL